MMTLKFSFFPKFMNPNRSLSFAFATKLMLLPDFAKREREACLVVVAPLTLCQCDLTKKYMTDAPQRDVPRRIVTRAA